MKAARIVVLMIAIGAGGVAYVLSRGRPAPAPTPAPVAKSIDTVDVLVAKRDIGVGQRLVTDDLGWQNWPLAAAGDGMIRESDRPDAVKDFTGAVARGTFTAGEPIREQKLIRADGSGFLSAILPGGMRAVSAEVAEEKRAGGFVLPNDRVDVMLTRTDPESQKNGTGLVTETILTNVRVLAIGQVIEDKEGQRSVAGKATATLELSPRQSEILASASENGTLSLALRSLADSSPNGPGSPEREANSLNIVRYGVPSIATTR